MLGLPGLISTLELGGAGGSLTIHTFEEGKRILTQIMDFFGRDLSFDLRFNVIRPEEAVIFETPSLTVRTIPLRHRIPTVGYVFEEKPRLRHIRPDMIAYHKVPVAQIRAVKEGADFIRPDGSIVPNEMLTSPADKPLSYAHISDTIYMPELAAKIGPVDLLFHETTYLESHAADARNRFHSTAKQAAAVARDAGAGALLTGHYSSRYSKDEDFLREAKEVFPDVILNRENLRTDLD